MIRYSSYGSTNNRKALNKRADLIDPLEAEHRRKLQELRERARRAEAEAQELRERVRRAEAAAAQRTESTPQGTLDPP